MRKLWLSLLVIGVLPIFLHVYNPSMHLGGFGLFLGVWGMTVSPALIGWLALDYIKRRW